MSKKQTAGLLGFALVFLVSTGATAATVSFSASVFDNEADLTNTGSVWAYNLGSATTVTVHGVDFVDGRAASLSGLNISGATDTYNVQFHQSATSNAVAGLTTTEQASLLDNAVFGLGVGTSLVALTGLTIGQEYEVDFIVVRDRNDQTNLTQQFGYATPAGNTTKLYTLTGLDISQSNVRLVTGTFKADETTQDLHLSTGTGLNSFSNAMQLRTVPEPATMSLLALGGIAMLRRRRK